MALSSQKRAEAIDLIAREADFERSGISGRTVRDAAACPRQGELTDAEYQALMGEITANLVRYVVFSYTTPIAWVGRDDSVTLVERKFSATTSQHQKMVLSAFKLDQIHPLTLTQKGEALVQLSENEEVILRRMRDEYGTEYKYCLGGGMPLDGEKFAPRDQVEPLIAKGLVQEDYPMGAKLTDKGREHLDKIQPVVSQEAQVSQYVELTEDELIELADDLGARVTASATAVEGRRAALELVAVVGALKARRDATAPARRRIGEYLRQQGIVEAQYEKDVNSNSDYVKRNAKPVLEVLDELRSDLYARQAKLRLADLRMLVTPVVRDTKAEFEAEQQRRLELWTAQGLPEKQAAFLECIAKGHMRYSGSGTGYHGDPSPWNDPEHCKKCGRPDGRTMQAMSRKKVFTELPGIGHQVGGRLNTLMLTDPEKRDK
jgi:hypothetical protein